MSTNSIVPGLPDLSETQPRDALGRLARVRSLLPGLPELTGYPNSYLEEFFMWAALKYLDPVVSYDLQVPAPTPWGNFRLDSRLSRVGQSSLGLELDGAAYHDPTRDLLRDAAILAERHVHAIVRIEARYVLRYREQTLWLLSQAAPWLMSPRGHQVLERQMRERGAHDAKLMRMSDSLGIAFADELPGSEYEIEGDETDEDRDDGWWEGYVRLDIRHPKSDRLLEAAAIMDANRHLSIKQIATLWDAQRKTEAETRVTTCYYCNERLEITEGGDHASQWYHVRCEPREET